MLVQKLVFITVITLFGGLLSACGGDSSGGGSVSAEPTITPTIVPTAVPTAEPTVVPTVIATDEPDLGNIENGIYVASDGSDASGDGSVAKPYQSIAKAAEAVKAGDIVLVSGGTYVEENITPAVSGEEGNYITFRRLPDTGSVVIQHPSQESSGGPYPVFNLSNRDFVWIEGFHFKDFVKGIASIYISGGESNVVLNNIFENLGDREVATWNGNQVVGVFNSERTVVCNNYFHNITGDGVNVNGQSTSRNLVCNNSFSEFDGKLRSWGGEYTYSRAIDVQDHARGHNLVAFNHAEDVVHHVWLDRDGSNNIILRNYGNKGSGNVFNESRCKKNVVQENIAVEMKVGYMTSYYTSTGWTEDARWINNVSYNSETGFNIHKSHRDEFRNNIVFDSTEYNIRFSDEALANGPHIFANNLWYSAGADNSMYLGGIPNAVSAEEPGTYAGTASSVADFQLEVGETGGLSLDPLFNGDNDFTLQSSSPAKNVGDNGLDLGAYAYYPKISTGWDGSASTAKIAVYFDQSISSVVRGETTELLVRLSKPATEEVSVDITPVAGDAVIDDDFTLAATRITFAIGETEKTVQVVTNGSFAHDELVAFKLENASGASASGRVFHALRLLHEANDDFAVGVWLEPECGTLGSNWATVTDTEASGGVYATEADDYESPGGAPDAEGQIVLTFNAEIAVNHYLWIRADTPSATDDSFWISFNGETDRAWNEIGADSGWEWKRYSQAFSVNTGENTLTIGIRENGAKIDKIYIGSETPEGIGPVSSNACN